MLSISESQTLGKRQKIENEPGARQNFAANENRVTDSKHIFCSFWDT